MRSLLGWLVTFLILIAISVYTWKHVSSDADSVELVAAPAAKQAQAAEQKYEEAQGSQQVVTMAGPLANYMKHSDDDSNTEDIESLEYHPVASDHVGGSVAGTSATILKKTFAVTSTVQLPFSIPAHAYSPQLHGSFRSYLQGGKLESNASKSDVEFLVLNDEEYDNLLHGRPSDALFSAEAAHDQEVNANLPPTLDTPVTYHLVFRNDVRGTQRKLVQAEFRVDY
jgi:hypothetical protein